MSSFSGAVPARAEDSAGSREVRSAKEKIGSAFFQLLESVGAASDGFAFWARSFLCFASGKFRQQ